MDKLISVVIPTKDKLSRLLLTLKALKPQLTESVEIIVVFDGCKKEIVEKFIRSNFKNITIPVILKKNIGRSAARNAGIKKATGEIILFVDDDRIPDSHFIQNHYQAHKNGNFAVIGIRKDIVLEENDIFILHETDNFSKHFNFYKNKSFINFTERMRQFFYWMPFHFFKSINFVTGNLSIRKSELIRAGFFDENFCGWGYEDIDLGYRLVKNKVKLKQISNAVNYHIIHPINWVQLKEQEHANNYRFLNKIKNDISYYYFARYYCNFVRFFNNVTGRWG